MHSASTVFDVTYCSLVENWNLIVEGRYKMYNDHKQMADNENSCGRPKPDTWSISVFGIITYFSYVAVGGSVNIPSREDRVTK